MDAIRSIEDRHGYPYVFLNDEESGSDEFKTSVWYPTYPWIVAESFAGTGPFSRDHLGQESISSYGQMECVSSLVLGGTSSRSSGVGVLTYGVHFLPRTGRGSRWGFFGFFFAGGVGSSAIRLFGCWVPCSWRGEGCWRVDLLARGRARAPLPRRGKRFVIGSI
ncbi:hypothetical protein BDZ89DRAFT_1074478 [Hymenopellis radicata]|nr:hypothetical protein BDZ89DRAFT_1074478 [Hymenopellis radicata]